MVPVTPYGLSKTVCVAESGFYIISTVMDMYMYDIPNWYALYINITIGGVVIHFLSGPGYLFGTITIICGCPGLSREIHIYHIRTNLAGTVLDSSYVGYGTV